MTGRISRTLAALWQWWPVFLLRYYLRETWRDLPGPWWARLLLLAVVLAIPGPQDELILLAILRLLRSLRARRERPA